MNPAMTLNELNVARQKSSDADLIFVLLLVSLAVSRRAFYLIRRGSSHAVIEYLTLFALSHCVYVLPLEVWSCWLTAPGASVRSSAVAFRGRRHRQRCFAPLLFYALECGLMLFRYSDRRCIMFTSTPLSCRHFHLIARPSTLNSEAMHPGPVKLDL